MIIDVPPMSVIVFSCTPAPAKKTGGAGKKAAAAIDQKLQGK